MKKNIYTKVMEVNSTYKVFQGVTIRAVGLKMSMHLQKDKNNKRPIYPKPYNKYFVLFEAFSDASKHSAGCIMYDH